MSFQDLGLSAHLLRAIADAGYTIPTPVQHQAIPPILEGRDLLGCSQTGTGKTAAFALPILQRLTDRPTPPKQRRKIRALILAPTRELAAQIGENFVKLGRPAGIFTTVVFGGVSQLRQTRELQRGVDVVVATPGRLLDLCDQGFLDFSCVEVAVLDEADHMLDMGFLPDVRRILDKLPRRRQSLLFSATMPEDIRDLANHFLKDPIRISITPEKPAVESVTQGVYMVTGNQKSVLLSHLLQTWPAGKTLIFTRTKRGANRVAERLEGLGIESNAIHGNKSQNARERALEEFRTGQVNVLVATDIAARGIDVRGIDNVINFDFPDTPETYIHRIGRTGRAGLSGNAVTFCSGEDRPLLVAVEKHLRSKLKILTGGTSPSSATDGRQENERTNTRQPAHRTMPQVKSTRPVAKRNPVRQQTSSQGNQESRSRPNGGSPRERSQKVLRRPARTNPAAVQGTGDSHRDIEPVVKFAAGVSTGRRLVHSNADSKASAPRREGQSLTKKTSGQRTANRKPNGRRNYSR